MSSRFSSHMLHVAMARCMMSGAESHEYDWRCCTFVSLRCVLTAHGLMSEIVTHSRITARLHCTQLYYGRTFVPAPVCVRPRGGRGPGQVHQILVTAFAERRAGRCAHYVWSLCATCALKYEDSNVNRHSNRSRAPPRATVMARPSASHPYKYTHEHAIHRTARFLSN